MGERCGCGPSAAELAVEALERIATSGGCSRRPPCPPDEGGGSHRRPGKNVGTSTGDIDVRLTPGDLDHQRPPGSWPGERNRLLLPMLFIRANPGDTGTRPVVGPFWESPDIFILAGVAPPDAPERPGQLGQIGVVDHDNTLYAHIWNFGLAAAPDVLVDFAWADPSLGINASSVQLIGQTSCSLGPRGSGRSHAIVKCPESWRPRFTNGGHECLLVRAWTLSDDRLNTPEWDASLNRHVGQRNIHVVQGTTPDPISLRIGPLYGAPGLVSVTRAAPATMPWLLVHAGSRGSFPRAALATGSAGLSSPRRVGNAPPTGTPAGQQEVTGDDQAVSFTSTDDPPGDGQAHVYRVIAEQDGTTVGGYTVVVLG
jgi:hypothetical protein